MKNLTSRVKKAFEKMRGMRKENNFVYKQDDPSWAHANRK